MKKKSIQPPPISSTKKVELIRQGRLGGLSNVEKGVEQNAEGNCL